MLDHLDSLKSTLLQKSQDRQLSVNSLKEKNQRLESGGARNWGGGEDLASKLEKDFKDIGLDITRDAITRTHRIGPVVTCRCGRLW